MKEQLNTIPEDAEVPVEDDSTQQAEPLAETPEGDEEESATPEDEDDDEGEDEPERKTRSEKRKEQIKSEIDRLTREKYEAKREAEAFRRQAAEMQSYLQQQQPMSNVPDIPKLADYDYDEGRYQQAIQQWHVTNMQQEQARQYQAMEMQQRQIMQMREQQAIAAKIAQGTRKYADFNEVVNDPSLPPLREINPAAFETLLQSDVAEDLAYYLGKNRQEVYALAEMTPAQAIKKVAQLEAKLAKSPATARIAPRPPSTVRGTANAVKNPEKMSTEEWLEWRNNQLKKR